MSLMAFLSIGDSGPIDSLDCGLIILLMSFFLDLRVVGVELGEMSGELGEWGFLLL